MATKAPANGPSKTINPSGPNRGNNQPAKGPVGAPSKPPAPAGGKKK